MLVKLASSHSTCAQLLGADLHLRQRSQERKGRIGKERQEKQEKKTRKTRKTAVRRREMEQRKRTFYRCLNVVNSPTMPICSTSPNCVRNEPWCKWCKGFKEEGKEGQEAESEEGQKGGNTGTKGWKREEWIGNKSKEAKIAKGQEGWFAESQYVFKSVFSISIAYPIMIPWYEAIEKATEKCKDSNDLEDQWQKVLGSWPLDFVWIRDAAWHVQCNEETCFDFYAIKAENTILGIQIQSHAPVPRPQNMREAFIKDQKASAHSIALKRTALQAALDENKDFLGLVWWTIHCSSLVLAQFPNLI